MKHLSRLALAVPMLVASGALGLACFTSSGGGTGSVDSGLPDVVFDGFAADTTLPEEASADAPQEALLDSSVEASGDTGPLPEAGNDGTVVEAGTDAALDAAADAPVLGATFYVDPANGIDTNDGSMGAPFQSIAHAAQIINTVDAGSGPNTLYLADGTYSATNQPSAGLQVSFTKTTFVRGSAPGNVIILGQGPAGMQEGLTFQQGGGVLNVTFKNTWYGVEAIHGTFSVAGCTFDGAGGGGYFAGFINDTVGTFDTTGSVTLQNLTGTALGAIYVDNTAKVSWIGGGTTSITGGGPSIDVVFMRGGAQLTIDGVTLTSYLGYFLVGYDQSNVTVKNSTFTGSGCNCGLQTAGVFYLGASQSGAPAPSLTLNNTTITGSQGNAVAFQIQGNTASVSFNATGSHLDGSTLAGIWVAGIPNAGVAVNVTATSTTFNGNGLPGIYAPRATVSLSGAGSSVSTNGALAASHGETSGGIVVTDATSVNSVTLRGVAMGGNTGNQISFTGTAASILDLGTSASPGGLVFSNVPAGVGASAVALSALIPATAIGNTWMPNVQGANASGLYTTTTTISGAAVGLNVTEPAGASVVMAP